MNFSRTLTAVATMFVAALLVLGGTTFAAQAAPGPVPSSSPRIEPGVGMVTAGIPCTANFIFTDAKQNTYVGYAARCAAERAATRSNGCEGATLPLGTRVRFVRAGSGASKGKTLGYGTLAYSSWTAMKRAKVSGPRCHSNDFALVKVNRAHLRKVSPTVPQWGGPVALGAMPKAGGQVFGYAGSALAGGHFEQATAPRMGPVLRSGAWGGTVAAGAPGTRGESGSGYLDSRGHAVGVLSARFPGSVAPISGVGSLARQVGFARQHGVKGLKLVRGHVFGTSAVL